MEQTKLEFADGRRINIESIYGGPQLINGAMRDTLKIEVDPKEFNFNSLKALFGEPSNLETISFITETDGSGDVKSGTELKTTIGTGYTILVSISDEFRTESPVPGSMNSPSTKEVIVVTISQETYAEHQLRILQNKES